jgi:hypothetical protein
MAKAFAEGDRVGAVWATGSWTRYGDASDGPVGVVASYPAITTIGASFPAISAPLGVPTSVEGSVTTPVGGTVRTDSDRFDLSLDGETFTPTVEVEAGTTDVWLGVTPQAGDGPLSAKVGVPV